MTKRADRTGLPDLEALALSQGGYFDRTDAHDHGIGDDLLTYHVRTGRFERCYPGVFRLRIAPISRQDELLLAWVWSNYRATISHESALALYSLSDVRPSSVHLIVPPTFRRQPGPFELHWTALGEDDVTIYEGLPVTTPARSIVDAAASGTGPEQIQLAIHQAVERALASSEQIRAAAQRPGYRHRRRVLTLVEATLDHAAA
jgi:predicted transcriptional regulator of viral defense system